MNLIRWWITLTHTHAHTIDTLAQSVQKWFSWAKHMGSCLCYWPDYFSCLEIKLRRTYPPPWVGWKTVSCKQSMQDRRGVRDSEAACLPAFKVVVWLRRQQLTCLSTHDCRFHLFPCQSVSFLNHFFLAVESLLQLFAKSSIHLLQRDSLGNTWNAFRQTHTYVFFFFLHRILTKWGPKLQSLGWLQIIVWRKV